MKKLLLVIASISAAGAIALPEDSCSSIELKGITLVDVPSPTNFLTISNCVYVTTGGKTIIRVNDEQWRLITNAYSKQVFTNNMLFYKN